MPVRLSADLGPDWEPGPLPLNLRSGLLTDIDARSSYFDRRACKVLYADGHRWHRWIASPESHDGVDAWAFELLLTPSIDGPAHLLIHWDSDQNPVRSLQPLVATKRPTPGTELRIETWFPTEPAMSVAEGVSRVFTVTFGEPDTVEETETPHGVPSLESAFRLASMTPQERFTPAPSQWAEFGADLLPVSSDWSSMVLRDGAAFVAHGPCDDRPFLLDASVYVHTIYTDTFLLGSLQRYALRDIVDDLGELADPTADARALLEIERRFARFRNDLWWQHLTQHGVGNELLRRLHAQHGLPDLVHQVTNELRDHARQANLVEQGRRERRDERLGLILAVLTVFAIPLTVLSTIADVKPGFWADRIVLAVIIGGALFAGLIALYVLAWRRGPSNAEDDG